ncbi:MAG: hypothetical protein U0Y82_10175 [Thermoleophilia bacterium]
MRAAACHADAGDLARAASQLHDVVDELPPGDLRSRARALLGQIAYLTDSYPDASAHFQLALEESPPGAARILLALQLAYVLTNTGRLGDARDLARQAVREAEDTGDASLIAPALAVGVMMGFLLGDGLDRDRLDRALALEPGVGDRIPIVSRPTLIAGLIAYWTGDLEAAHADFVETRRHCLERGEESDLVVLTRHGAALECARGDVAEARRIAEDGMERSWHQGAVARAVALANTAVVEGWTGDADAARAAAGEALGIFQRCGWNAGALLALEALGNLALAQGDHAAAAAVLADVAAIMTVEIGDPAVAPWWPTPWRPLPGAAASTRRRPSSTGSPRARTPWIARRSPRWPSAAGVSR